MDSTAFLTNKKFRNIVYQSFERCMTSKIRKGKHSSALVDINTFEVVDFYTNKRVNEKKVFHAEDGLMNSIDPNLDTSNLFVFVCRANLLGEMKYSKPCENCRQSMKKRGIRFCVFSSGHFVFQMMEL